ncbi:hypothetical protein, variant 1 [Aphanomyces astaci]|nr:hypothetical protein, variant 1 [Aphanomyces astaci]ETV70287.1 hypothetical protein, variant 1 [Aphanomyces astaci]|eukprot:XP_009840245.1 hypothetical protein, variant 1 [Aphanomyces astaci]
MELNPAVYRELGLPSAAVGSLVIAWTAQDLAALPHTVAANHAIGDTQVKTLSAAELYALEPHLAAGALGAVFVPGEIVIEPWLIPIAYLHHGLRNGGTLRVHHHVVRGAYANNMWTLHCESADEVRARWVVNCAGLYGDIVEQIHTNTMPFHIHPRKGQYVVLDAPSSVITRVLQPVPTDRTKGVFVFRNLHGLVVVGPTAEDQHSREDMTNTPDVVATLRAAASQIVPALAACPVVGTYAGLRPATEHRDYHIAADGAHQWVVVGGIRSTGVTASLGIAEYVGQLIGAWFRPRLAGRHVIVPYVVPTFQELAMQFDGTSNSVTIEGLVHQVTHPLTRWGLQKLLKQQQDTSRL